MKNLLLVLSLVITASPAFASRARLESLGEGKNGSYYINDSRNIFLNPAAINGYKKKLFIELGSVNDAQDSVGTNKVQGGFTNTFGDFVYGLYLGRESDRSLTGTNAAGQLAVDHALDFFFGGEASGTKYGVDVFYAGALNRTSTVAGFNEQTAGYFGVKLGADINNFAVFTTIGINSKAVTDTHVAAAYQELKGKLSLDVGATYTMDEMTYLAKFTSYGSDFTVGTTSPTVTTGKTMAYALGAGWKKEASKSVTIYSRVQAEYQKDTTDQVVGAAASTNVSTATWYNLPLVLAAEAQATSWLTVRGSISHSLYGQHAVGNNKDSFNNQTTAAMGLGFNFGDLTIDALAGQTAAVANAASESSQGTAQAGSKFGFGDQMLTRLSMTYNF